MNLGTLCRLRFVWLWGHLLVDGLPVDIPAQLDNGLFWGYVLGLVGKLCSSPVGRSNSHTNSAYTAVAMELWTMRRVNYTHRLGLS